MDIAQLLTLEALVFVGLLVPLLYTIWDRIKTQGIIGALTTKVDTLEKEVEKKADKDDHERVERHLETHVGEGKDVIKSITRVETEVRNINKKLDKMNGHHK